ncbi:MAG: hypothetical protein EBU31_00245 [Proteobacteria bacterium]|nr:hypothetical protein [Pseudomonadota bacterium]
MSPQQQRDGILEGLADGKSLRSICRQKGMPSVSTVMRWLGEDEEWQAQYARARAAGDDAMAEDIHEVADRDDLDPNDKRVRIDARKWLLAKRQPKKYGDTTTTKHEGGVTVNVVTGVPDK